MPSYPVAWWEHGEPTHVGALLLHDGHLELDGRTRDGAAAGSLSISYDELLGARVERFEGRPVLVLRRAAGDPLSVAGVGGIGTLTELAERIGHEVAARPRGRALEVVVVGGGVAGVEALLALRAEASGLVDVTLLSAGRSFAYRPLDVRAPFRPGAERRFDLATVATECGARLRVGRLAEVDAAGRRLHTDGGETLGFDVLLLALGAAAEPALDGAVTFRGAADAAGVRAAVDDLLRRRARSLAFAVPAGVTWPLPLYELAFQTAGRLRDAGVSAELTVVTAEEAPLAVFGEPAAEAVAERLAAAGIAVRAGRPPVSFERGALGVVGGEPVRADHVIALPRLVGPAIPGLPADERGFVPVDSYGHVRGLRHVFAAGDATSFPIKQGGIATQQAATAATGIAARAGAPVSPAPFRPVLRGLLLTGAEPLFLRNELGGGAGETSVAATEPLWWPPSKIAGPHLSAYLGEGAERVAVA